MEPFAPDFVDPWPELSREDVVRLNLRLQARISQLEARLEELERRPPGGARPFSRGVRKPNPQKPGRKPGQGSFCRREPPPEHLVTSDETVDIPFVACPDPNCAGTLQPDGYDLVTTTDLPEKIEPVVHRKRLQRCRCNKCGSQVLASHPDVPPDQRGATAHRLGIRVKALAHHLHYSSGMSLRKLCEALGLMGIQVTPSALSQDAFSWARGTLQRAYAELEAQIKKAWLVHTDDTSWAVGGAPAWVMAFCNEEVVYFAIRDRHRAEEVEGILGEGFEGFLCSDRFSSYRSWKFEAVLQQVCLSHILRSIHEEQNRRTEPSEWLQLLTRLLQEALALWHAYQNGEKELFHRKAPGLQGEISWLLQNEHQKRADRGEERIRKGLHIWDKRDALTRFLVDPRIPPTNNEAERTIRQMVINRKTSQCSRNWDGARTTATFVSILGTLKRRKCDPLTSLIQVMQTGSCLPAATGPPSAAVA